MVSSRQKATKTKGIDYFVEAVNPSTNNPHEYAIGKDYFGEKTKIITDDQVRLWCEHGPTEGFDLPTWVKCKDKLCRDGKWYRTPDESCNFGNLNLLCNVISSRWIITNGFIKLHPTQTFR